MRKILINYRRADSEYAAGSLGRELRRLFGDELVFRDKENIGAGISWKQKVLHEIASDSALLVLISKDWANARDGQGERRLDTPDDPIRLEIADGLRDRAIIIPILLENAEMPSERDLPSDIKPLAELNARRLRDGDWAYDLGRIVEGLEQAGFEPVRRPSTAHSAHLAPTGQRARGTSVSMVLSYVLSGILAIYMVDMHDSEREKGFALFGLPALGLALLALRAHRRGVGSRWATFGSIALAALVTAVHLVAAIVTRPSPGG